MKIEFRRLLSSDSIASLKTILNTNLELFESSINAFTNFIDTDLKKVQGVTKIEIFNGPKETPKPDSIGIDTNQTIKTLGDVLASEVKAKKGTFGVDSGTALQVTKGDSSLGDKNSKNTFPGAVRIGGGFAFTDIDVVVANNKASYIVNGQIHNYTGSSPNIVGNISMRNSAVKILNFSNFVETVDLDVKTVKILDDDVIKGTVATLIAILPAVPGGNEFILSPETITAPIDDFNGIKFTKSYSSVQLIFDGTQWIPISMVGTEFVTL